MLTLHEARVRGIFSAQFKQAVELRKKYLYLYRLQFSLTVAK